MISVAGEDDLLHIDIDLLQEAGEDPDLLRIDEDQIVQEEDRLLGEELLPEDTHLFLEEGRIGPLETGIPNPVLGHEND